MAEIRLSGVSKRYPDGHEAVRDMNLRVADGEFMILVGPSGCGKSTALRMIAGLEEITAGEVTIDGRRVNELGARDRDVAMVFQNYALYPHMTVRDNMGFALKLAGRPKAEIAGKVAHTAEILDLAEHLDRKPAALSGGQRQRVAMGRAIVRDPKAFLMDEPLSNLDAKLRVQMRTELARLQRRLGTTTLYVTHDQTEAMTLGDRVAVLRDGVIQQVDRPRAIYDAPVNRFVAGFIGSPAMNFLPARLEGETLRLPFGDVPLDDGLRARLASASGAGGGAVVAGVRPEHFEDARIAGDRPGLRFTRRAEVVESLGSEALAYFDVDAGGEVTQLVARLSAGTRAAAGEAVELHLDTTAIQLFDPADGRSLTAAVAAG
jgi:multiple sugar transport system ATP-binding protein